MPIAHAPDHYPVGVGALAVFETMNMQLLRHGREPKPMPQHSDTAPAANAVHAFVNDARWIVTCPDCAESQVVSKADHRFCCFQCLNFKVEGRWRPVIFPQNIGAIEAELEGWPLLNAAGGALRRRWVPGETVRDLHDRKMDQLRPSVPRIEDLAPGDQERLRSIIEAPPVAAGKTKRPPVHPTVEWGDDDRTEPVVHWPKKAG